MLDQKLKVLAEKVDSLYGYTQMEGDAIETEGGAWPEPDPKIAEYNRYSSALAIANRQLRDGILTEARFEGIVAEFGLELE